jgi:ATP-dependent RNA helicase DeaD
MGIRKPMETDDTQGFDAFELSAELRQALRGMGFVKPTPIQAMALPEALKGRDVLGKAQTGTGKTLAFGLPLLNRVDPSRVSAQALVLLPTRELAQQVAEHLEVLASARGLKVALLVGGEKVRFQRARIPGSQVIVGTPGRILDLLRENLLHIEWAEILVLDEFDRMLDMGFIDEVRRIRDFLPTERQTMAFSATVPPEIRRLLDEFLTDPFVCEVSTGLRTAEGITQHALRVAPLDRMEVLLRLLDRDIKGDQEQTVLVFCNTRRMVGELDRELFGRDFPAAAISGDYEQSRRFQVIDGFREKRIRILVATDVASRGLDVDHVGHVINFDVPLEVEDYVHRIGRTARAGRKGRVTTLVIPAQERSFVRIQGALKGEIKVGSVRLKGGGPRATMSPEPTRFRGAGRNDGRRFGGRSDSSSGRPRQSDRGRGGRR